MIPRWSVGAAGAVVILLVVSAAGGGCSGPGSPSGPLDAGSDDTGSGDDDAVTPVFDAPVVGPLDAAAIDEAGKTSTCTALTAYAKCNGATDPCAAIDLKDCFAFDAMYNLAGRHAITTCYGSSACGEEAGTVSSCVYGVATTTSPGSTQKTLATHVCDACSPKTSAACQTAFYDATPSDSGVVGLGVLLELSLISDDAIRQLDTMCVAQASQSGTDCSDVFGQCAGSVLTLAPGQCTLGGGDAGADAADPGGA